MKECNKCKQVLALDMFNKRRPYCKICQKQHDKQYHQKNRDKLIEQMKQYYKQYEKQIPAGVYMIKCLINGKKYVGQSIKPITRRDKHFTIHNIKCSKRTNTNTILQADIKLYGKDKFVFGIVEYCEPEQLLERETYYINLYKPEYNLTT